MIYCSFIFAKCCFFFQMVDFINSSCIIMANVNPIHLVIKCTYCCFWLYTVNLRQCELFTENGVNQKVHICNTIASDANPNKDW